MYFTFWELDVAGHPDPTGELVTLFDAYQSATQRPFTDDERDALPLALARQPLWSIAVWAAQLDHPDAVRAHLRGHEIALRLGESILGDIERWRHTFDR